jgi:hypothetical protein
VIELPPAPGTTHVDLSRPECRALNDRLRELGNERRRWADRLASATSYEERQQILRTIEGLDDSISLVREEMYGEGCYVLSTPFITRLLGITHLELTQIHAVLRGGPGPVPPTTTWFG